MSMAARPCVTYIARQARMLLVSHLMAAALTSLHAQAAPLVSGRVTDVTSGSALANVEVLLSDGARTISAADGSYRLRALDEGAATLTARRLGFAVVTRALALVNGQVAVVSIGMRPVPVLLATQRSTAERRPDAGTTVIGRAAIERQGARDLAELLRGQPGLTLVPRGGPGAPVTVSIRGSSANQVLVLLDGTPVNSPVTGEADLSLIDPANIDHVNIVRGAQSSRYGGQALGGVIALRSRSPRAVIPQGTLGGGQWGERRAGLQAAAAHDVDVGTIAGAAGVSWQQTAGRFTTGNPIERGGGMTRRANADARRVALNGGVSLQRRTTTFDLRTDLFDIDRGMPGSIVQPSLTARQTQRRTGVTASAAASPDPHRSWRASVTAQRQTAHFADAAPPFGAPFDQRQAVHSLVASAGADVQRGRMTVTAGAESRRLGVRSSGLSANASRAIVTGGTWVGVSRGLERDQWQLDIGASARGDVGTLWRGVYVSPDLHVALQRGAVRAGASWRSAFSAPSLGDLFFQDGVQVQPNPNLRPERVRGEWTASLDLTPVIIATLPTTVAISAYRGDIDALILWSPDFRFVWRPDNFDVSRRGADASLRVALPSQAVALTLAGSVVDVRYRGAVLAGQVIYRPRLTGSATLAVRRGASDAQVSLQATGARRTVIGSDINRLRPFALAQGSLAHHVALGAVDARLRTRVDNLLDQSVSMLVDYPFPGRTWSVDVTLSPRSPRAARLANAARSFSSTSSHGY